MARCIRMLAGVLVVVLLTPAASFGVPSTPVRMTVPEIVALPPSESGRVVSFTGEAIGEALRSDDGYVWVNVLDDGTAIGVHIRRTEAEVVDGFGDWRRTGAIVEVVGTVNTSCSEHHGDFDIHAHELRVLSDSEPRAHPARWWKLPVALVSALAGALLFARLRYLRRKETMI